MMAKRTIRSVLVAARKLIVNRRNWTQWAQGRDKRGNYVIPWDENAVRFCALGAINAVVRHETAVNRPRRIGDKAMQALARAISGKREAGYATITAFNNHHSHAEVVAAFDKAIAKQRKAA